MLKSIIPILLLPQRSRRAGVYNNFISITTRPIGTIYPHMKVLSRRCREETDKQEKKIRKAHHGFTLSLPEMLVRL